MYREQAKQDAAPVDEYENVCQLIQDDDAVHFHVLDRASGPVVKVLCKVIHREFLRLRICKTDAQVIRALRYWGRLKS